MRAKDLYMAVEVVPFMVRTIFVVLSRHLLLLHSFMSMVPPISASIVCQSWFIFSADTFFPTTAGKRSIKSE